MFYALEEEEKETRPPEPWWKTWTGAGVAAVVAACVSAASTYYNIRLAEIERAHQLDLVRQKARFDINISYLGMALDAGRPLEVRQQLLRFLAKEGEENQLKDWAQEELTEVNQLIERKTKLEADLTAKEAESAKLKRTLQDTQKSLDTLRVQTAKNDSAQAEEFTKTQSQVEALTGQLKVATDEAASLRKKIDADAAARADTTAKAKTMPPIYDARRTCIIDSIPERMRTTCLGMLSPSASIFIIEATATKPRRLSWTATAPGFKFEICECATMPQ